MRIVSLPWKKSELEVCRDKIIEELQTDALGSEMYKEHLTMLHEIDSAIEREKKISVGIHIDPNTVLVILGSICEIILMMNHERLYSFTSKAMSRMIRPKL